MGGVPIWTILKNNVQFAVPIHRFRNCAVYESFDGLPLLLCMSPQRPTHAYFTRRWRESTFSYPVYQWRDVENQKLAF